MVTDSTSYLPEGFAERHRIRVVPLHVTVNDGARLDGVDLGPDELAAAMRERAAVSTSRPTPDEMAAVYRAALAEADHVVGVHISSRLSGTWEAGTLAAREIGGDRVRVVDSRSAGMGLGFAVLAAAQTASAGVGVEVVAGVAAGVSRRTRSFFCVETLEHLRRGGRIGTTAALLGTALAVKPVLHVSDGRIAPLEKVRTSSRAMSRLVDLAVAAAGQPGRDSPGNAARVAVHHLGTPRRATELATIVDERLPASGGCLVSEVGAAIGAHTGPGMLGVVVVPGGFPQLDQVLRMSS